MISTTTIYITHSLNIDKIRKIGINPLLNGVYPKFLF